MGRAKGWVFVTIREREADGVVESKRQRRRITVRIGGSDRPRQDCQRQFELGQVHNSPRTPDNMTLRVARTLMLNMSDELVKPDTIHCGPEGRDTEKRHTNI